MQVTREQQPPTPPPEDDVVIRLSPAEAGRLMALLRHHEATSNAKEGGLFYALVSAGVQAPARNEVVTEFGYYRIADQ